jgi:SPP1 gp7 family putative phage head morphogenesis protein
MTGRIQQVVANYRQQLNQHDAQAQRTLSDAYKRTLASIQPALDRLYQQIDDKQQAGQAVPLSWLYEEHRLENIKQLVRSQINHYSGYTQFQVEQLQRIGVSLGSQSAQAQLQASVPKGVNWQFGMPDTNAINDLVSASQPGSPLHDLFSTFGSQAADDVAGRLITGITLGQGPRMVARSVADALDIPRARALTIARTEMLRAYRSAALENYKANDDVVGGWIWSASLSPRTCAACIAMNGTKHTLDETLDSHPNCRCAMVPETKSWSDILGPLGISTANIPDTTVDIQSGSDWLDNQDEATQQAILGNKYSGWSNGDFTLDDLVGTSQSDDWGSSIYVKSLKQLTGGK